MRELSQACENCRVSDAHPSESRCVRCGAAFHCGIDDAGGCWCTRLPPLPASLLKADASCLCPACLEAAVGQADGIDPLH
jgi:hypothetical protein